jgi:predicted ATPase
MRQGLAAKQATGAQLKVPYYQGLIAGLQIRAGRMAEASCLLEEALARVEATGERWCEAELHRLKGEASLLAGRSGRAEAEAQFRRAIEVSRKQGARWWELHGASSLARIWAECGRRQQAYDLLAPVHGWFAEGFDTQSLRDAGALLDQLGVTGTCVIPR